MPKIINGTPHSVVLIDDTDTIIDTIPVSDTIVRLEEQELSIHDSDLHGAPCRYLYMDRGDLPSVVSGVFWIVSRVVAMVYSDRRDFLVPDRILRDEDGHIIGCRGFAQIR